jgi:hypothetical protein
MQVTEILSLISISTRFTDINSGCASRTKSAGVKKFARQWGSFGTDDDEFLRPEPLNHGLEYLDHEE